jgi:hypothetical protein
MLEGHMQRFIVFVIVALVLVACGGAPSVSAEDVLGRFKAAALDAETPTKMDAKAYGLTPFLCQDGARRFLIPSLGPDSGGRLFVCANAGDATKLKTYYDKLGEGSAIFHSWTYQKGGVLVQINGGLDQAQAEKYGAVIAALP